MSAAGYPADYMNRYPVSIPSLQSSGTVVYSEQVLFGTGRFRESYEDLYFLYI
jgi:hypothetical protein